MTGEVAQQQVTAAAERAAGAEHHVAVGDLHGGQVDAQVFDVQGVGVEDLGEHPLGHLVLGLQALVVGEEGVALLGELPVQAPHALHGCQLGAQQKAVQGLGDEVVAAAGHAQGQGFVVQQGGDEQHRGETVGAHGLDEGGGLVAVHLRHHHVHEDHVRPVLGKGGHRSGPVLGFDHPVSVLFQEGAQDGPPGSVVVHHQEGEGWQVEDLLAAAG